VKLRLFPQENATLDLLSQMAQELRHGVSVLSELLGAPVEEFERLADELHQRGSNATDLQFALMTRMRTSFINPLPREDLYDLACLLNDAMEALDSVADLISLHELDRLSGRAAEQLEVIGRQAELTTGAMLRLNSFDELEEYWLEMLRLSRQAERTHRIWNRELLRDHKPVVYIKHRDVAEQLVGVAKCLRRVSTFVGNILVKES
jgi:uncharacterized protein